MKPRIKRTEKVWEQKPNDSHKKRNRRNSHLKWEKTDSSVKAFRAGQHERNKPGSQGLIELGIYRHAHIMMHRKLHKGMHYDEKPNECYLPTIRDNSNIPWKQKSMR